MYSGYSHKPEPFGAYVALFTLFNAAFTIFVLVAKASGKAIPERLGTSDLLVLGGATYKLSRLISRDRVTSFLRAPFTELTGPSSTQGEVIEKPRGRGIQRGLGELLTNPVSVAQWVASCFVYGLVLAPRTTRLLASIFTLATIADFTRAGHLALAKAGRLRHEPDTFSD